MNVIESVGNLEELECIIRKVMPQHRSMLELKKNVQAGFIDFKWNGHHFAIKPNLHAFELRDGKLYITAGSLLLQSALATKNTNEQAIFELIQDLDRAVDTASAQPEEALSLMSSVKHNLQRLIRRRPSPSGSRPTAG